MKGNFDTIASPEQPSGAILPERNMRVTRRRCFSEILTVTKAVAHFPHGCHEPVCWDPPPDVVVVRPHPELLQQVNVVVGLVDEVANGRHPQLFVVGTECCRHSPGIE